MIRTRKSTGELVMPYETFKHLGYAKVCRILGLSVNNGTSKAAV